MPLLRLLLPLILCVESSMVGQVTTTSPPNVVLIISDDQAWTDYGFMGHPTIKTPHLDRLAAESRVYRRGYVPSSLCCPSLASIITGLYPHQHGITGNEPPIPKEGRNSAEYVRRRERFIAPIDTLPSLPRLLGERGYASFQSGKWWLGNYARGGFTHGMTHGDPKRGGRHGDLGLTIGRSGLAPIEHFLDEVEGRPFFLWYAPFLPHQPHNPPARFLSEYTTATASPHVARYEASCSWFDETCGSLLALLDARHLTENTLVIYVTDNGWIQDEGSPRYARRSKRSPYDQGLRTPVLLRWPGHIIPAKSEVPISSLDIAPTVLAACGATVPKALEGLNLLDESAVQERDALFGDVHLHDAVSLEDPSRNVTYRWMLSDGLKLIVPNEENVTKRAHPSARAKGGIELYDVLRDPYEINDLAETRPAARESLKRRLDAWWTPAPR